MWRAREHSVCGRYTPCRWRSDADTCCDQWGRSVDDYTDSGRHSDNACASDRHPHGYSGDRSDADASTDSDCCADFVAPVNGDAAADDPANASTHHATNASTDRSADCDRPTDRNAVAHIGSGHAGRDLCNHPDHRGDGQSDTRLHSESVASERADRLRL